ncbi:Na+/H+ antiporter subunit E [Chthonobacter albigriseus]|uniref:Na+/H+ antiporter subunit E n=1 Tax=Chthonobacter albigriseus TaxID=1683161 RepID=UPI0015EFBA45
MQYLVLSAVLAVAWSAVNGSFSVVNILFGFALGALTLSLVRPDLNLQGTKVRPLRLLSLIGLFLVELIKSGIRVAKILMRRDLDLKPGMVAYPLADLRDFEITLLANLITLTPGTLSVDVSDDRRLLYVHCVDMPDAQAVIDDIRGGFEKKILETFR